MATKLICDGCGGEIDQSIAYYQITAVKIVYHGLDDPTAPNTQTTIEVPQSFDYHDGHQPIAGQAPEEPEPTHPIAEPEPAPEPALTELVPTTAVKLSTVRVLGSGLTDQAVVVFNGNDMDTTLVSDSEVTFQVPDIAKGAYNMHVHQDGSETNSLTFTVR